MNKREQRETIEKREDEMCPLGRCKRRISRKQLAESRDDNGTPICGGKIIRNRIELKNDGCSIQYDEILCTKCGKRKRGRRRSFRAYSSGFKPMPDRDKYIERKILP